MWLSLECSNSLLEMEYFPKRNSQIQHANASYRAAHPTRRDYCLQTITGLARGVEQKVVVTPITQGQAQESLRDPGQKRQGYADFEAQ